MGSERQDFLGWLVILNVHLLLRQGVQVDVIFLSYHRIVEAERPVLLQQGLVTHLAAIRHLLLHRRSARGELPEPFRRRGLAIVFRGCLQIMQDGLGRKQASLYLTAYFLIDGQRYVLADHEDSALGIEGDTFLYLVRLQLSLALDEVVLSVHKPSFLMSAADDGPKA